jgi:hypothetical protein
MQPDQFFSHLTAAELLGLRLPDGFVPGPLHVSSTAPRRAPRCAGVVGHQAEHPRLIEKDGLRLTSPLQTWLDCSRYLGIDDLIVMGDGLIRRKNPEATGEQLRAAVRSHGGRSGAGRLSRAIAEIRPNTDSARETLLRLLLCRAGYPEPEPNGIIFDTHGRQIAHGDLLYREYKVLVEYDGGQHRLDSEQFEIDIERPDTIRHEGWRVERVGKSLMRRQAVLLAKVEAALRAGGWTPKQPIDS